MKNGYTMRNIDEKLWTAALARAAEDGRTMKITILRLLRLYAVHGLENLEAGIKLLPPAAKLRRPVGPEPEARP